MFIGKEGEFSPGIKFDALEEKQKSSWSTIAWPKNKDVVSNICGLRCTLKDLSQIAAVVDEKEECIRAKIIALGHQGEPAILKTGTEEDMRVIAKVLSKYVCCCYFVVMVIPSL